LNRGDLIAAITNNGGARYFLELIGQALKKSNVEMVDRKFNKLKVIKLIGFNKHKDTEWHCVCECGKHIVVSRNHLQSKNTQSCGCLLYPYKLPEGESAFNKLLSKYKQKSKERTIQFTLDANVFRQLVSSNCQYCNIEPKQVSKNKKDVFLYNGIDRVDSSLGYCVGNVVPCCFVCNRAKSNLTLNEFQHWVYRLTSNMLEVK